MGAATTGQGPDLPTEDRAFHIEQHGIDYIPERERWARPRDLAGMWAGASVQIEYFVYGAILVGAFGFSFRESLALILIGNLSYLLLGVCSLQGPEAGTTVFAINRAPYGPHGSRLISLFNWLTQIGFEVEGLLLIVGAGLVLMMKAGLTPGTPAKVALALLAIVIQAVLPFLGHATIVKTLRWLIVPCLLIFAVLLAFSSGHLRLGVASQPFARGWQPFTVGLAFTIALSGLGWAECGNDYSRYLPRHATKSAVVWWVFAGTALPQVLVMTVGAAVGTFLGAVGTNANAFLPLVSQSAVPGWFVAVFLVFSILQLFGINSLDLYSSGVTLQALGLRVRRYQAVLIDSVICIVVTLYALFNASFKTYMSDFVACVIAWIAPWVAIFLTDWVMRRLRYAPYELQRTDPGSLYWASGGINWAAIVAQAVGTTLSVLSLDQLFYAGPIARVFGNGGADMSIYTGLAGGGLVYVLLGWPAIRRQSAGEEAPLAEAAASAEA